MNERIFLRFKIKLTFKLPFHILPKFLDNFPIIKCLNLNYSLTTSTLTAFNVIIDYLQKK